MEKNVNYINFTAVSFCYRCFLEGFPRTNQRSAYLDDRSNLIFLVTIHEQYYKRFKYTPGFTPHLFMSRTVDMVKGIVKYNCSCGVCEVEFVNGTSNLKKVTSVKGVMSIERWREKEKEALRT